MVDELGKAIRGSIYPALKPEGFLRTGGRDLVRVEDGIVQRLYFQISAYGSRDFCVTACANLIAANDSPTLQPGFRIKRDINGSDLWLPSKTPEEAKVSAEEILRLIRAQALPYFEQARSVHRFLALLAHERWGSEHHLNFQRGVAAALVGDTESASRDLDRAIQLYEADGRS